MDHEQPTDTGKRHKDTRFMEIFIYFLNRYYGLVLCNLNNMPKNYAPFLLLISNYSSGTVLLKNYKNAHKSKIHISKNALLLPIFYTYQNKYIIECLQILYNPITLLLICYVQILLMHLYNHFCYNCAYPKVKSIPILFYLNKQKRQIYRNG